MGKTHAVGRTRLVAKCAVIKRKLAELDRELLELHTEGADQDLGLAWLLDILDARSEVSNANTRIDDIARLAPLYATKEDALTGLRIAHWKELLQREPARLEECKRELRALGVNP